MIEINLIPDVKREYLKTRSMRNFVISISVVVIIGVAVACVALGLVLGGQLVAQSLQDGAIKEENKKLMEVADLNKTVTIQQQLNTIEEQHNAKHITSRLFDVMSVINPAAPNDVRISNLRLDPGEKTVTIEGSAQNGYIALEVFKKTITNTHVVTKDGDSDVKVPLAENIVAGETAFGENAEGQRVLRFSFTFTYPDQLFAVTDQPVAVETPVGRVDVTDSKLGIPGSIFEPTGTKEGQ